MVSLHPSIALRVIYGKDSEQKQSPKKDLDTRTHLERIKDALNSGEKLENLTVDYKGGKKALQDYVLEDALSSSDTSAVRFILFPDQEWNHSIASERMIKYFWGYNGWIAFYISHLNSSKLSKVNWMENYDAAQRIASDLSRSIDVLVGYPVFSHLPDTANIRKVKGAIDGSIVYMQKVKRYLPEKRFFDLMTKSGRKKLNERWQLELKLQQAAYGLTIAGKVENMFISDLGRHARKEYLRANPEQLKLF